MKQSARTSMPVAAPELLHRLSAALGVHFTLTDEVGAVLASTSGQPPGRVDPLAVAVLRRDGADGNLMYGTASPDCGLEIPSPALAGFLEAEPSVCCRVQAGDQIRAALIVHGPREQARTAAEIASISLGFILEFARSAAQSAPQGFGPDLALNQLLKGSRREGHRAALVARVLGWDLTLPRVAVVVMAAGGKRSRAPLHQDHYAMIAEFIEKVAPGTPMARMHPAEWVLFPELPNQPEMPAPRQLAQDVLTGLLEAGASVTVGLGEPHAESSLLALRRSYREARHAARWGERLHGLNALYQLRDVGLVAFVTLSQDTRRRLSARILQPLRNQSEVLASLEAFLECDRSIAGAADRTGLHRHTIRHHLDRVRDLTGLDPRSLEDALQLRLALLVTPGGSERAGDHAKRRSRNRRA